MTSQESQSFRWRYSRMDDSYFQVRGRTLFFIGLLVSVIIFIAVVFLYIRWFCRLRLLARSSSSSPPPSLPLSVPSQGLDQATINGFPVILIQLSTGVGESECCICLGKFEDGEKVKVLPDCHHCYHSECVDKWLKAQPNCPLCRASLLPDSAV